MSRPPLPPTWPWGVFQTNERHCLRQIGSYITLVRGYNPPPSLISGSTVGCLGQMVTIKELAGGALPLLRGRPTSSLHHPKKRFAPFHFSMNGHYLYLALPPHKSLMQSQNQRGQYLLLKQCSPHLQSDTVMSTNHFNPKCTKLMFTYIVSIWGFVLYSCGVCRHRVLTRPVNRL